MKSYRVVLVGPESTGKTTLARDLAAHFGAPWVPEASRAYAEEKQAALTFTDVMPIAHRHCRDCDAVPPARLLVLDTDLVMTCVYSDLYYQQCPPELFALAGQRRADLYLLLDTDVPWVPDPVRDMPHRRDEIRDRIARLLEALGAKSLRIRGDWATRRLQAIGAIKTLIEGSAGSV